MDISENIKDSFMYPTKDWTKILILGAFVIVMAVLIILSTFLSVSSIMMGQWAIPVILFIITIIFSIFVGLIYEGYGLSILRDTINGIDDKLPEFDWGNNLIDGLKVFVLTIVYGIIPVIVGFVLGFLVGGYSDATTLSTLNNPNAYLASATSAMVAVNIITFILSLLFSLVAMIAMARLAETGSFSSIFEFEEIFKTISNIGWGNYIVWFIVLCIVLILITVVTALVNFIPVIGTIIFLLVIPGFVTIFKSRSIGLIYNESK